METPWRIELLGWLRAQQGEHVITRFATRKSAALLACLALWPRRAHAREELIDRLWPDADQDSGRQNLRQALTSLRRQLEPLGTPGGSVLITDRTHIRLNPAAVSTDVADFEAALRTGRLADALAFYKGELLPGFYEEWIQDERERLQSRVDEVAEQEREHPHAVPVPVFTDGQTLPALPEMPTLRLPMQFTQFFGREAELSKIAALLARYRLVTLTGPGGAGKTRLAVEAARRQPECALVAFAGLADVADGTRLPEAVADALHLSRDDRRPALERICDALNAAGPVLLVLDNAEHLAAHAGPFALALLTRVPTLRLLASSRRRLHMAGEREFPVPALPVPEDGGTPEQIAATVAVQLFVDRAQAVRPDFQVTPRNAADIAALCRRLEGSPLALELAAARVSALAPAQMLEKLSARFALLATRRTDKDARHRSLWAAIAWSADLLPASLRHFWAQLSVFRGGFTPEAASAVTGEEAALEALTQLRERSLVNIEETGEGLRFRLLDSLREFADAQMDSDERRAAQARQGAYFLSLAQQSEDALRGPEQGAWLDCLTAEHDNLRAALEHGIGSGDAAFSLSLAASLWGFWERRGHLAECRRWLERALALPAPAATPERAKALNRLGTALNGIGDMGEAARIHAETLTLYETLGDAKGIALAWDRLGFVAHHQGRHAEAQAAYAEALARERALGNRFNCGAALTNLGVLAQAQGDYAQAQDYYAEALACFEALGVPAPIADTLLNLAAAQIEQAEFAAAAPLLARAGALFDALGDRWSRAYAVLAQAVIARHQGQWDEAARLAAAALQVCREVGDQGEAASALRQLGIIAQCAGDFPQAAGFLQEALRLSQSLGQTGAYSQSLCELGLLAAAQGHWERAARLLGAAEAQREQANRPLSPAERPRYEQGLASARHALGAPRFSDLWAEGRALPAEDAVAEALADA